MNETGASGLVQILEGAILAADHPLTVAQMANLFEEHERPETAQIREALTEVAQRCDGRGFELQEVASGFRFQVRQNLGPWVARLWVERPARYSRALLETLALIAYRQPITRGEIEEVRGVAVSSNIIKTLQEREWIRVVGHRDVPGRPAMYATTRSFLDYFNLKSLDQLPALAEIRDLETLTAELGFEPLPEESAAAESDTGEGHEDAVADGGGAEAAAAMTSLEQDAPGGAEDGAAGDAVAGIEDDEADATRGEDGAIDQGGHRAGDDQNSAADASDEAGDEALAATTVEGADTDDSRGESELSIDALRKAAEAAGETAGPAGDDAQGEEHG